MDRLGIEQQYLASLREVLDYGKTKHPERKLEAGRKLSHHTKGISCVSLTHHMDDGFPLLTTRKLPLKNTAIELEGFIKGITDKKWFEERGCPYWREWSNPKSVDSNDLGPLGYSWGWRKFGQHYEYNDRELLDIPKNGVEKGYDQLDNIVQTLKTNPNDRRMICSAVNPTQLDIVALPSCHTSFGIVHYNGKIDLWFTMRSCDFYLGWVANIASYALLLLLLAKESGFKANKLTSWLADCHIYSNQFDNVKKQLERKPFDLPTVNIINNKSIFDWTHQDFELLNYHYHPALSKIDVVV